MTDTTRAVFFDLDGTLIRDGAVDAAAQAIEVVVARHPQLDAVRLRTANQAVWSGCWSEQGERWMRGELADDALVQGVWRRTLERSVTGDGAVVAGLLAEVVSLHLDAERRTFSLFEESRAVLIELRRRGIPVGLITNGPSDSQREKLRVVGIEDLFDLVLASGDIGVLKPDAEIFHLALDRVGVPAGAALYVGDNFNADVVGAVGAGLAALWVNRDASPAPRDDIPHHAGSSLLAVLDAID